jgi:alpha-amylase
MDDGAVHSHFSPYETPFMAFTNYMNALADFIVRVEEQYPLSIENEELDALLTTIRNQAREIATLNKELTSMRKNVEHYNEERKLREALQAKEEAPAKPKKAATKKAKVEEPAVVEAPVVEAKPKKRCVRKKKEE